MPSFVPRAARARLAVALAALALAAAALAFFRRPAQGRAAEPQRRPNVLLVSIDTLRADHLGCYGYHRPTSPVLDALAAESVRYANALAPTPWTLPSHVALLTGAHPYELGIRDSDAAIPEGTPMLGAAFAAAGYQTAAFVDSGAGGFVGADRGFGQGFETYRHAPWVKKPAFIYDMAVTANAASKWLARRDPGRPFFQFLHTKSAHAVPKDTPSVDGRHFPYDKPMPWRFRFVSDDRARFPWSSPEMGSGQAYLWSVNTRILDGRLEPRDFPADRLEVLKGLYDNGIAYTDEHLGRVFQRLRETGAWDDTLVAVTSDHGEGFLEHNLLMHQEVYRQLLHVPLIVRIPGGPRGVVVDEPVALADVAPTLLRLAGLGVPRAMSGLQLPLSADGPPRRRGFFAYYLFPSRFKYRAFALQEGDRKLVLHNYRSGDALAAELYDVRNDPLERRALAGEERRSAELRETLRRWAATDPAGARRLPESAGDERRTFKSVGYID